MKDKKDSAVLKKRVTAVVCTLNSAKYIKDSLESLKANGIEKIILVDADSDDNTRAIASPFVSMTLTDPRQGLAVARNAGLSQVDTEFILNWGADNVLSPGTIEGMLAVLEQGEFAGVTCRTRVEVARCSYLSWAMNEYKRARFRAGLKVTIGTPSLFKTSVLRKYKFDPSMSWSDDSELCTRMGDDGHRFYCSEGFVIEVGMDNFHSVRGRWFAYGKSDDEVYTRYSDSWSFSRRVRSAAHPFLREIVDPIRVAPITTSVLFLPFLLLVCGIRYYGWLFHKLMRSKNVHK